MGNRRAEDEFYRMIQSNKGIIIRICNSYCADPVFREDLAQEIIYQLWKSGSSFSGSSKFSTWMYRIALNVAISYYRRSERSAPVVALEPHHTEMADAPPEDMDSAISRLQQCISRLNPLDRALMILYLDEKPYAEIADILGISTTNVATKISRIKEKIKQQF